MVDDDCALLCNISTRVYCVGGLSIGSGKSVCMTWVNSNLVGHKLKLRCNFLGVLNKWNRFMFTFTAWLQHEF